jgi:hypothetical protein
MKDTENLLRINLEREKQMIISIEDKSMLKIFHRIVKIDVYKKQYEIIERLLEEQMNDKMHKNKHALNKYVFYTIDHRILSKNLDYLKDCRNTLTALLN